MQPVTGDITENSEYDDARTSRPSCRAPHQPLQENSAGRAIKDSRSILTRCARQHGLLRDKDTKEVRNIPWWVLLRPTPPRAGMNESPVGQAIIGKRVGDEVTVPVPVVPSDM